MILFIEREAESEMKEIINDDQFSYAMQLGELRFDDA